MELEGGCAVFFKGLRSGFAVRREGIMLVPLLQVALRGDWRRQLETHLRAPSSSLLYFVNHMFQPLGKQCFWGLERAANGYYGNVILSIKLPILLYLFRWVKLEKVIHTSIISSIYTHFTLTFAALPSNNPQVFLNFLLIPSQSHKPQIFPKLLNINSLTIPRLIDCISQFILLTYKISIQTSTAMNSRKPNRIIVPLGENNYSPDIANKFNKNYYDVPTESCSNPPLKEFNESPDCVVRRVRGEDFFGNYSIQDLNIELDKNLDDIMALLSKRKTMMAAKKRRILEDAEEKLVKTRHSVDPNQIDFVNDDELLKITSFCQNPRTAVKMLGKIIQTIPNISGPRIDQEERSEQFWGRNRKLQNDIDIILQKLKSIDKQLQKENGEVLQICRELDRIQQTLKSFVGAKSPDHVQKVEPLFNSKKKNYDVLNKKIKEREISKDKKIDYIKRIKNILDELKRTREERLGEIAQFFGIENSWQFDKMNFKEQGDFGTGLEELLKIKERDNQLELSEKEVLAEFDILEKDQERIYNELTKRISDEAKAFHHFNSIQNQRIKYTAILTLFQAETDNFSFDAIDPKEYIKRFKEAKVFFKRFLEEDTLLKQGLVKTSQTTKTFVNLLKATENQKERRHQLLSLLEACIRKRVEYEQKREEMRTIIFEESRNEQELTQHEEDLEAVLTDGDLDGYRKIGNAIGKCETEKHRLLQSKEILEKQMESMDRQVLSIANRIQEEYEDILSDVLPSDYEYSLKTGEDVKKLRNQLRKMYKRLGLLTNQ